MSFIAIADGLNSEVKKSIINERGLSNVLNMFDIHGLVNIGSSSMKGTKDISSKTPAGSLRLGFRPIQFLQIFGSIGFARQDSNNFRFQEIGVSVISPEFAGAVRALASVSGYNYTGKDRGITLALGAEIMGAVKVKGGFRFVYYSIPKTFSTSTPATSSTSTPTAPTTPSSSAPKLTQAELEKKIADEQKKYNDYEAEITQLNQTKQDASDEHATKSAEHAQLVQLTRDKKSECERKQADIDKIQAGEYATIDGTQESARSEEDKAKFKAWNDDIAILTSELNALKQEHNSLAAQGQALQIEVSRLSATNLSSGLQVNSKSTDAAAVKKTLDSAKKELQDLLDQQSQTQTQPQSQSQPQQQSVVSTSSVLNDTGFKPGFVVEAEFSSKRIVSIIQSMIGRGA